MERLKAPFISRVGGGGVLTFRGAASGQAVHWSLNGRTPAGDTIAPLGDLKWECTVTGKHRCATNIYYAPETAPAIDGSYDQVTARCVLG